MSKREIKQFMVNGVKRAAYNYAKRSIKSYMGQKTRSGKRARTRGKVSYKRLNPHRGPLTRRKIRKKLKSICNFMKQQTAIHVHKQRAVSKLVCPANEAAYDERSYGGSIANHETAVSSLRYFDPGTNSLVTADPSVGTYERDIEMSITRKITVKNNYDAPVYVIIYKCTPKFDTGNGPIHYMDTGFVDQGVVAVSKASPLMFPKESIQLRQAWTLHPVKRLLQAGQEMTVYSHQPTFKYNFATNDTHNVAYQRKQAGFNWLVRINGKLAHDTAVITEFGITQCGVDLMWDTTYTMKYAAGKDLHDFSIVDNTTGFTNCGTYSSRPVTDHQCYGSV